MSLVDEVAAGVDGLSQLCALMASGRKPGILVVIRLVEYMAAIQRRCLIPLGAAPCILVLPHRRPSRHWS